MASLTVRRLLQWLIFRGVAQPGSASAWGAGGRRFKSCHPDHKKSLLSIP